MSAVVTFEIKTVANSPEVLKTITRLWQHEEADLTPNETSGTIYVTLSYYYAHDSSKLLNEQAAIKDIIKYLFSIAADGKLYYFRDGFGDYPDYERALAIDELFTEEFEPSMDTHYYWRYLINPN